MPVVSTALHPPLMIDLANRPPALNNILVEVLRAGSYEFLDTLMGVTVVRRRCSIKGLGAVSSHFVAVRLGAW